MSESTLNIAKLKDEYPLLRNVWTTYNDFDNDVYVDNNKNSYYSLCDFILNKEDGELSKYGDFCMKILRNLGYLSTDPKIYAPTSERCNMLYNWIYSSIDEKKITDKIVNKCFENYNIQMDNIRSPRRCYDFSQYKIYEPIKLRLLDIFDNNMLTIKDTLKDRDMSISAPCRKYVCECVKIYKQMNKDYCLNEEGKSEDYKNTCLKLKQFKIAYNFFLTTINDLNPSLPSVNYSDNEFSVMCPSEKPNQVLTREIGITPESTTGMETLQTDEDFGRKSTNDLPEHTETVDGKMRKTITTTIGTFAGASSLLAFLYKFTPAGRLVNPKLRRTTGIINNNFYGEEANGMLFDGNEHNGFNSYNIGYEAV
ncbi:Plasmodium vivax Vir protein, putative [Plasmodium vivax]|nr:Plasmodium vivax Vir protein, putative [Plasmodium vivax]